MIGLWYKASGGEEMRGPEQEWARGEPEAGSAEGGKEGMARGSSKNF